VPRARTGSSGIDSFDQRGVELRKVPAQQIMSELISDEEPELMSRSS
jgi:glucose-6-phosphate isomerase